MGQRELGDGFDGVAGGVAELTKRLGPSALDAWRRVTDALIDLHLAEALGMVQVAAAMSSGRD